MPDADPIIEHLLRHCSVRRFTADPLPDDDIRRAVAAGQAASTSSAIQAYTLIRVTDDEHRRALVDLTGGQSKVASCAAFFIVCGDTRRHRLLCARAGVDYDARLEAFLLATVDATLFAQNLVVAFEAMGYGMCYIGGLRNQLPDVQALLGFPEGIYPLYGLCVGVPDESPLPRPRLPLDAVYCEDRYPDDDAVLAHLDAYDETYRAYLAERGESPDTQRGWSEVMAPKFATPQRTGLASYYESLGADFT